MPKMKTNRSAAKRFKATASGRVIFHKSCAGHILAKKTRKRKRRLRKTHYVDPTNMAGLRRLLPYM
ncbi:MAG: 50S ribosomal protein L35 [Desulfatibacillaceae bacterium]|nr:50S ribosomal protein L35 [Desulfatibacillaceae bacterium]